MNLCKLVLWIHFEIEQDRILDEADCILVWLGCVVLFTIMSLFSLVKEAQPPPWWLLLVLLLLLLLLLFLLLLHFTFGDAIHSTARNNKQKHRITKRNS